MTIELGVRTARVPIRGIREGVAALGIVILAGLACLWIWEAEEPEPASAPRQTLALAPAPTPLLPAPAPPPPAPEPAADVPEPVPEEFVALPGWKPEAGELELAELAVLLEPPPRGPLRGVVFDSQGRRVDEGEVLLYSAWPSGFNELGLNSALASEALGSWASEVAGLRIEEGEFDCPELPRGELAYLCRQGDEFAVGRVPDHTPWLEIRLQAPLALTLEFVGAEGLEEGTLSARYGETFADLRWPFAGERVQRISLLSLPATPRLYLSSGRFDVWRDISPAERAAGRVVWKLPPRATLRVHVEGAPSPGRPARSVTVQELWEGSWVRLVASETPDERGRVELPNLPAGRRLRVALLESEEDVAPSWHEVTLPAPPLSLRYEARGDLYCALPGPFSLSLCQVRIGRVRAGGVVEEVYQTVQPVVTANDEDQGELHLLGLIPGRYCVYLSVWDEEGTRVQLGQRSVDVYAGQTTKLECAPMRLIDLAFDAEVELGGVELSFSSVVAGEARSSSLTLPEGQEVSLRYFAPMGEPVSFSVRSRELGLEGHARLGGSETSASIKLR